MKIKLPVIIEAEVDVEVDPKVDSLDPVEQFQFLLDAIGPGREHVTIQTISYGFDVDIKRLGLVR